MNIKDYCNLQETTIGMLKTNEDVQDLKMMIKIVKKLEQHKIILDKVIIKTYYTKNFGKECYFIQHGKLYCQLTYCSAIQSTPEELKHRHPLRTPDKTMLLDIITKGRLLLGEELYDLSHTFFYKNL